MPRHYPFRFQIGLSGWISLLAGAAILLVTVAAIAFLAVGVAVILLPLALAVAVFYYFRPAPKIRPMKNGAAPQTIDGEFRVVDEKAARTKADPAALP